MAIAARQPQHGSRPASSEPTRDTLALKRSAGRLQGARTRSVPAPVALAAAKPDRTLVGIMALLVSVALFPVSDIASKMLTATLPGIEVAWMRYLVFVVMTVPLLLRDRSLLRARRPGLLAGRAIASAASTALFIVAFGMMPVANATAIGFLAPVVVTALAALFLREKVGLRRWSAALVGPRRRHRHRAAGRLVLHAGELRPALRQHRLGAAPSSGRVSPATSGPRPRCSTRRSSASPS